FLLQPAQGDVSHHAARVHTGGQDQNCPKQRRAVRLDKVTDFLLPPFEGLLSFVGNRAGGLVRCEGVDGCQNGNTGNQSSMCHERENSDSETDGKSEMVVLIEAPKMLGL